MFYAAQAPRSIGTALNLVWVLYWQTFVPRSSRESMKLVWVFAEPAGQMAVLMLVFTLIGRNAAYGTSFALFLLTGVTVLTLFTRGSALVSGAILGLRSGLRLAQIGLFHSALARIGFALTTSVVTAALLAWGVAVWDQVRVDPVRPGAVAQAFGMVALLAFGIGLIRGHASRFLPVVERVFSIISRALLFLSGTFYVPSFLPPHLREVLVWNPVLHGVELMRIGVYGDYPSIVVDPGYLLAWALGAAGFGMTLAWVDRRRLLE